MTVNIENGQGVIDIVSDEFVSCLRIKQLVLIECYDCVPTTARYYAGTPDQERVVAHFNEVLTNSTDQEVLNTMTDFLQLFGSGTYTIEINRNIGPRFWVHSYNKTDKGFFVNGTHDDGITKNLLFTQDPSTINKERVSAYEQLIAKGVRPKAVVFQAAFKEDRLWGPDMTSMYILDGHHKLLAYQNLKIEPELVIITKEILVNQQQFPEQENLYFDYEHLLSDEIKQQIICCAPKMIVGYSDYALQYNQHLDISLTKTGGIGPATWTLFKEALNSGEKDKIDWVKNRLDNLGARQFERSPLSVATKIIFTQKHPQGIYESLIIRSQADYTNWVESLSAAGKN